MDIEVDKEVEKGVDKEVDKLVDKEVDKEVDKVTRRWVKALSIFPIWCNVSQGGVLVMLV